MASTSTLLNPARLLLVPRSADLTLSLAEVPIIEEGDFHSLIEIAKSLDERLNKQLSRSRKNTALVDDKQGSQYNEALTWDEVLKPHGFKLLRCSEGESYWQKPQSSDNGHHVTTNYDGSDLLFCFSSICPPFETQKPYDKFTAYAVLNHGGDFAKAEERLSELGYETSQNVQLKHALRALAKRINFGEIQQNGVEVEGELRRLKSKTKIGISSLRESLKHEVDEVREHGAEPETFSDEDLQSAEELLSKSNLFAEFIKDFRLTGYRANTELATAGLLFLGRTLLATSSALYCYGKSSSGKSEFIAAILMFFPHHRVVNLTKVTPKYLYRAGGKHGMALTNKILVFGEMRPLRTGEDDNMQEAIRQLVSENKLSLGSVDDVSGQRNVATQQIAYGPVTMAFSGTRSPSEWDDQMINRSFCQSFKHSHDSIQKVLRAKATTGAISSNPFSANGDELALVTRKWRAVFSVLRPITPESEVRTRRIVTVHRRSRPFWRSCERSRYPQVPNLRRARVSVPCDLMN
jgi:hypothetical protein